MVFIKVNRLLWAAKMGEDRRRPHPYKFLQRDENDESCPVSNVKHFVCLLDMIFPNPDYHLIIEPKFYSWLKQNNINYRINDSLSKCYLEIELDDELLLQYNLKFN